MQTRKDPYYRISGYYEKILGRHLAPLRANIRAFLNHMRHTRVLDICCGTGKQLEMLAAPEMKLWGLDSSQAMLAQASRTSPAVYILGDAAALPFGRESVDAVILSLTLHEQQQQQQHQILRQAWDCLRAGGHLVIVDYCRVPATMRGWITGRVILPLVERLAGKEHYANYRSFMDSGALDSLLDVFPARKSLISSHFSGTVAVCSLQKETYDARVFLALNKPIS